MTGNQTRVPAFLCLQRILEAWGLLFLATVFIFYLVERTKNEPRWLYGLALAWIGLITLWFFHRLYRLFFKEATS
ncbi:hypothetical protein [Acidocella sp.]|uniref:hypothetical protein n=1 Tax=Acidocella sp. TaxID=50710 RepID=UPI003CFC10C8